MALEGVLQEFGLADILQLIYFQRKTGILNIKGKLDGIELSFINGNIAGLKSQRRSEANRLGKILIKRGLVGQKDLETAIEMQKTEGIKLGNIFVRHGLVTKEALAEIIQGQIIETIVQIFTWKEGRYEFIPEEIPVDKELPIYLDTQHLLMDGLRIVDEWSLVEGKLDLNTIYRQVAEPDPGELSEIEKEALSLIDDETDVSAIINISYSGDFETSKAIISLEEKGIIEPIIVQPLEEIKADAKSLSYYFYIAIFGVILAIIILSIKGNFDAYKSLSDIGSGFAIENIITEIDIYKVKNGGYPQSLEVITKEKDYWGRPYIYLPSNQSYKLFSAGPDGVAGTDDDVY